MRADEGIDNFRQSTQMKMEQTADGVMVVKPISLGRKRSETGGALERLDAGDQMPAAALVASHDGSGGAEPAVMQQERA